MGSLSGGVGRPHHCHEELDKVLSEALTRPGGVLVPQEIEPPGLIDTENLERF